MGKPQSTVETAALPSALRSTPIWSDEAVTAAGLPLRDGSFVTIGGGMASFVLVDMLRVHGVPLSDITVVSPQRLPYENFRHLARASQIKDTDPLRSDSMSRVDNIWGFPSYAVERAISERRFGPLLTVLAEPVLAEYYNPSLEQVYRGIDREADRIGWHVMRTAGRADAVRRRRGGGYFVLVCPPGGSPFALRARYVHVGVGYPALRYPPLFAAYRVRHGELFHVVNAYEPHEHVYEVLKRRGGTVVIRGAGIVASRVLERLIVDQGRSAQPVRIIHLFRPGADRVSGGDWRYQPFSFPKAASSGQLHQRLLGLDDRERAALIRSLGPATTARRRHWQRQLHHARNQGFYQAVRSEVRQIKPRTGKGALLTVEGPEGSRSIEADYVIDCTGLEPDIRRSPLLADLLTHGGATTSPLCGLDVGRDFEVCGTRSEPGRVYASGVVARGAYLAPVDSFFGFSHAALRICGDLVSLGFCPRLGTGRSVRAWLKWVTSKTP